jgi:glycosyltransferase involved in cell wall biosynthesis
MSINQPFRVVILLATYNGEQFLEAQLQSLISQSGVVFDILVNDDGSLDSTLDILKNYLRRGLIKEIFYTQNIGSSKAFTNLLYKSGDYDYVAFCDQDDIWDRDKLRYSLDNMHSSLPEIVVSERRYVNAVGEVIGSSPKILKSLNLSNALAENCAYGNTIVMNLMAKKLAVKNVPSNIDIDHWIYFIASAFGRVTHIPRPLISYRLHDSNQVGTSRLASIFKFHETLRKNQRMAQGLLTGYSAELSSSNIKILQNYLLIFCSRSPLKILSAIKNSGLFRQIDLETNLYKVGLLLVAMFSKSTLKS